MLKFYIKTARSYMFRFNLRITCMFNANSLSLPYGNISVYVCVCQSLLFTN
jgi:hypothetical protein